jgi:hypothetical protein
MDGATLDDGTSNVDVKLGNGSVFRFYSADNQILGSITQAAADSGSDFYKNGTGNLTFQHGVDLGSGTLDLTGGTNTFSGAVASNILNVNAGTTMTLGGNVTVNNLVANGIIQGNNTADGNENVVIKNTATLSGSGQITGVDSFTFGDDGGGVKVLTIEARNGTAIGTQAFTLGDNDRVVIRGASGTYTNFITTGQAQTQENLDTHFHIATGLKSQDAVINAASSTNIDIRLQTKTMTEYTGENLPKKGNNDRIGFLADNYMEANETVRDFFENADDATLKSIIKKMSIGELAADSTRLSFWKPYRHVFRHLDSAAPLYSSTSYYWGKEKVQLPANGGVRPGYSLPPVSRGQIAAFRQGYNLWFDTYITGGDAANRDSEAMYGYDINRWGMVVGGDVDLFHSAVAGFVFGYGTPELSNSIGKVRADDSTFGLYFRTPIVWDVVVNALAGYGCQSYDLRSAGIRRSFDGSSMYGSVEFSKTVLFQCGLKVKPLLAFEWQSSDSDGFRLPISEGGTDAELDMQLGERHLGETNCRLGVDFYYRRYRMNLHYIRQCEGNPYSVTEERFIGNLGAIPPAADQPVPAAYLRGVNTGRDWFHFGLGADLCRYRRLNFFLDGEMETSRRTFAASGALRAVYKW